LAFKKTYLQHIGIGPANQFARMTPQQIQVWAAMLKALMNVAQSPRNSPSQQKNNHVSLYPRTPAKFAPIRKQILAAHPGARRQAQTQTEATPAADRPRPKADRKRQAPRGPGRPV
jgi:hypothetical protein